VLDCLIDRGVTSGANRTRALISTIYNFGITRELVDQNPVIGVPKPTSEKARERVLTEEEIRRVWEACSTQPPRVAAWFRLRLATAQRGGEILQMRWQDLADDWWNIPPEFVKNDHGHRVYLNKVARGLVDTLHHSDKSIWVFPLSLMGDYKHVGRRLAAETRANIEDFRGHDLRRTAASVMTRRGVPRFIVARILNHSVDKDITGVYDRYSYDREKKAAMQFWGKQLSAVLAGRAVTTAGRFKV
jgi:integrase